MFAQFQTSYRRMEESLQRLTDSIAAYNPSPAAADALLAADDAVNEDLDRRMFTKSFTLMTQAPLLTIFQSQNIKPTMPESSSCAARPSLWTRTSKTQ